MPPTRRVPPMPSSTKPSSPSALADFGITLPTRQVPDAATAATAVEKRQATRVARHTFGKRQKANVKGTGATPATAPAPAPVHPPAKWTDNDGRKTATPPGAITGRRAELFLVLAPRHEVLP